ncbi:MAG: accessory gene regulator B family protein [Clostridiales bacterium]
MAYTLAIKISRYLIKQGAAAAEDEAVLAYGLFDLLAAIEQNLILLFLGLIFGVLPQIFCYELFFCLLKPNIGGAHAKTHGSCLLIFTMLAFFTAKVSFFLPQSWLWPGAFAGSGLALLLVLCRGPVIHPNAPAGMQKRKKFRVIGICVALSQTIAIFLAYKIAGEWAAGVAFCGSMGEATASLSLLIPSPDNNP